MADYKFYMKRVLMSADGTRTKETKEYDLESDFLGLRYKSLSGANLYGKPKGVYAETFAEDDAAQVFVDSDGKRDQTTVTLNLYFLDPNKYGAGKTGGTPYSRMQEQYNAFVKKFENCFVIYHDTARNRYMCLYLDEAHTLAADRLLDLQYIEASFKFKNVYGCSFATESDMTDFRTAYYKPLGTWDTVTISSGSDNISFPSTGGTKDLTVVAKQQQRYDIAYDTPPSSEYSTEKVGEFRFVTVTDYTVSNLSEGYTYADGVITATEKDNDYATSSVATITYEGKTTTIGIVQTAAPVVYYYGNTIDTTNIRAIPSGATSTTEKSFDIVCDGTHKTVYLIIPDTAEYTATQLEGTIPAILDKRDNIIEVDGRIYSIYYSYAATPWQASDNIHITIK